MPSPIDACDFIRAIQALATNPFFLYVAYTAPHWPLHARDEDIAKYRGRFDEGWDVLRERRIERLHASGVLGASATLSARDPTQPAWTDVEDKAWQSRRMEVYAAQIDRMDQGIGRILSALEAGNQLDNTLIVFLSDNGACAEPLPLDGDVDAFKNSRPHLQKLRPRNGRTLQVGNEPSIMPGGDDTYASYGRAWANLSNAPFRFYKRWTHEGGVATPLIVHWPDGDLADGSIVSDPLQLTDVMPTLLDAAGTAYSAHDAGRDVATCEGRSFLPALRGGPALRRLPVLGAHGQRRDPMRPMEAGPGVSRPDGSCTTWRATVPRRRTSRRFTGTSFSGSMQRGMSGPSAPA